MLGHYVYFSLHDCSPNAADTLIASAQTLLSNHEGIAFFAVGKRTPDLNRDVNDQHFDVALQIVFRSRTAHDVYQDSPKHHKFIDENKVNWKQIRVFDVDISNEPTANNNAD